MGKIIETLINNFSGGMSEDRRVKDSNKFALTKHFDTFTFKHKLIPNPITYAMNGEDKAKDIVKFLYALSSGTVYYLFALGKDGDNHSVIYRTDISSQPTGDWVVMGNGDSGVARNTGNDEKILFYYKNYLYFFLANNLASVKSDGTEAMTTSLKAWGATNVCMPIHHPNDDIAYFFADNKVHKLDDTAWTENVLTFPTDVKIVAACPYGNFLAIATSTIDTKNSKSTVYLWDRDSSLTTLTERIDFSTGEIIHMANLNNRLIVVQNTFCNETFGSNKARILIKTPSGSYGVVINELITDTTGSSNIFPATDFMNNNILYFPMSLELNGNSRLGIWAVNEAGKTSLDLVCEGATSYEGIYMVGNTWFIAHSNDGSTDLTFGTTLAYSTTNPSIYESLIFDGGEPNKNKKLIGVSVMTEKLLADGKIILKYKKDENLNADTWITIFTNTTDDSIHHSAINISGDTLPMFKEIQFKIESTGGAMPTGLKLKFEIIEDDLY